MQVRSSLGSAGGQKPNIGNRHEQVSEDESGGNQRGQQRGKGSRQAESEKQKTEETVREGAGGKNECASRFPYRSLLLLFLSVRSFVLSSFVFPPSYIFRKFPFSGGWRLSVTATT
jgi:hypothetical protein